MNRRICYVLVVGLCMFLTVKGSFAVPLYTEVRKVQVGLKAMGYDPGPIDGKMGSKTRKAIREFQRDEKIPETGMIDDSFRGVFNRKVMTNLSVEAAIVKDMESQGAERIPGTPVFIRKGPREIPFNNF